MVSSILFFSYLMLLFNLIEVSRSAYLQDKCRSLSCNTSVIGDIQFPFRLPQYQPDIRCGYDSNFTLSCSPDKQTLLQLSKAGSFAIYYISYYSQQVTLTDPNRCLPQRFLNFDLTNSPFYFASYTQNFTFYNCSGVLVKDWYGLSRYEMPCMSGDNHTVVVLPYTTTRWEAEIKENNCTLIKSVSAPTYYYSNYIATTYFELQWYEPRCGKCSSYNPCGFKGTSNLVECKDLYLTPTPKPPISSETTHVALYIIFPAMLITTVVLIYMRMRYRSHREEEVIHLESQMTQTQPSTATTGVSQPAFESNPIFVLWEGDALLEPDVSPCTICLSEYKIGDTLRTIIVCNHYFHSHCVDEWLRMKGTCPVCREGT